MPVFPLEPLFAHNARTWLRIWIAAQVLALGIATFVAVDRPATGGSGQPTPWPSLFGFCGLMVVVHAVGYAGYATILRRRSAVFAYLLASWAVVLWGMKLHGSFGVLVLGAILQGFIFLPFTWAAVTLVLLAVSLATTVGYGARNESVSVIASRVVAVLSIAMLAGTIILYIHRSNQEAALRRQLLRQLDEAHRDLAERARHAGVLEERQRVSQDLHDTVAQGFASVVRHIEAAELALPASDPGEQSDWRARTVVHLGQAQSVSRGSLDEIRRLALALRPTELATTPLVGALDRVVSQWGGAHGVAVTFTADHTPALHPDAEVVLLRATQESLSNVARHAHANSVTVTLACIDELVMLTVEDDGRGFAGTEQPDRERLGLAGMRERARRLGGYLLVESAPGAGTSVTVAMPLSAVEATPSRTDHAL